MTQIGFGTYEVHGTDETRTYKCVITVKDTTPPDLQLKDITIWDDQNISGYKEFIVSCTDISGEPTTECKTEMKFGVVGTQVITITAKDVNGNVAEKTCNLIIRKDTTGPTIYGLSNITVNKYTPIDFNSGVYAVDDKNGNCAVTADGSTVNTSVYGTYYATYTSVDLSGNRTVSKRKVTVNHDQEDLNNKISEFYNNYCAGQGPEGIAAQVREKIKYSSAGGSGDPIWNGLTTGVGNCYVHAEILRVMLNEAGYSNMIIGTTTGSHYWNLVYCEGGWWHLDSTPGAHYDKLVSDSQKAGESGLHGAMWDTSKYPATPDYNIR